MASENYSIKDLERLSGIKAHTIRIWEKRYGIINPRRTDTNIRYYGNEELKKILNISLLNQHGFKISAISELSDTEIAQKVAAISLVDGNNNQDEKLLISLIEMDEQLFNKTFSSIVIQLGFEQAIVKSIFPFFNRIGIMWQAGTINPAQEHFISNLIRNKLIVATESITRLPEVNLGTGLLFLPERELHEIALLFYNYALRARGFNTIYLGPSVPQDSLDRVISICKPSFIVTGMTNPIVSNDFLAFCCQLCKAAPFANVYFTGPIPPMVNTRLPKNALQVSDLLALMKIEQ